MGAAPTKPSESEKHDEVQPTTSRLIENPRNTAIRPISPSLNENSRHNTVQPVQQFRRLISTPMKNNSMIVWPLPPTERPSEFPVNTEIDMRKYSLVEQISLTETSRPNRKMRKHSNDFRSLNQARNNDTNQIRDASFYQSANVEIIVDSQTDLWAGMNTSKELNDILSKISGSHFQSNAILQQRLENLVFQGKKALQLIKEETETENKRLIEYAQSIQVRHEQLHREWMAKYLVELDRWRAQQLSDLHQVIDAYQKVIDNVFQRKLHIVNDLLEQQKTLIIDEERKRQENETKNILSTTQNMTNEKRMQAFTSEALTNMQVTIRANTRSRTTDSEPEQITQFQPKPSHLRNFL